MKLSLLHHYTFVCVAALFNCACSSEPAQNGTSSQAATTASTSTTSGAVVYCNPMPFMEVACSGVICHGRPGFPAMYNTDLINAPAAGQSLGSSLINRPANYNLIADPTSCPTATPELIINPTTPSESLILKKVMGTHACGEKMPNSDAITATQEDIDCLVSWVNGTITEAGLTVTGGTPSTTGSATTSSTTIGTGTTGTTSTTGTTGTVTSTGTTTGVASTTTGASSTTGTATTGGDPYPPTWETMLHTITYSTIFCGASDCHGGFEGRLDLREDEGLYTRLTTWTSEVCDNKLVVNPGNPEQSAILDVLTTGCGNVYPGCMIGEECIPQMPIDCQPGFDCIATEKVDAVRQWIANGAPGPQ